MSDELAIDSGALIFATLADVYLSSGMYDEAISILKDGLSRNPNYTLAKVILGRAYYLKDDVGEAVKVLEEAYAQVKDSENTNLYLGHCYRKLGANERAIQFYEAVLKVNPKNKEADQGLQDLKKTESAPVAEVKEEHVEIPVDEKPTPEVKIEKVAEPKIDEMVAVPLVSEAPSVAAEPVKEAPPVAAEPVKEAPPVAAEPVKEAPPVAAEPVKEAPPVAAEPVKEAPPVAAEPVKEPSEMFVLQPESKKTQVPTDTLFAVEEGKAVFPLEKLNEPMSKLLNLKSVRGALICSKDGLPIMNFYSKGTDIDELCAFIAAIFNEAQNALSFIKEGDIDKFLIEKSNETICVIAAGESLLTVITKPEAKPGLIFVYARKIIDDIKEILG